MILDSWVTIVPAPGDVKEVARALLALADSPADVRTQGTGNEFRVPPYLAERYTNPPRPRRRKKEEGED
jgi:hypothetical protein